MHVPTLQQGVARSRMADFEYAATADRLRREAPGPAVDESTTATNEAPADLAPGRSLGGVWAMIRASFGTALFRRAVS